MVTLNVYAHLLDAENQAAACRLDDVIFGNRSQNGHKNEKRNQAFRLNSLI
jgi:hypothetical protein